MYLNLSNLFEKNSTFDDIDEEEMEEEEDFKIVQTVIEKYYHLTLSDLNLNNIFNNLSTFLKVTSGCVNLQAKEAWKPTDKYEISQKNAFLRELSKMKNFSYLQPYVKDRSSRLLSKMFNEEKKKILNNHSEELKFFEVIIIKAINNILFSSNNLSNFKIYKLKKIEYLLKNKNKTIENYLEKKKK